MYLSIDWENIDITNLILYILGALVLAFILILIIRRIFFYNRKNRKMVRDLKRKYDYIHSLLLNQDAGYINRLESVANVNLLARPQFEEYNKRYTMLRDQTDAYAVQALRKMNENIQSKHKRQFKEVYNRQKPAIIIFERDVLALNKELSQLVKPEEDARQAAVEQKEYLRQLVNKYQNHRDELMLVEDSFDKAFANMEKIFASYDKAVEIGNYDESKEILKKISKIILSLDKITDVLPELCLKAATVVPQKIDDMERQFNQMSAEGYPLHHITSRPGIDGMRTDLNAIISDIKQFDVQNVSENLNKISDRINEILTAFGREKDQRVIFENEYDGVYNNVIEIERSFIKLANRMPTIQNIYTMDNEKVQELEIIKNQIDQVSLIKRTLDTFIHSSTRQPYSLLVDKMHNLADKTIATKQLIDAYHTYLENLKTDAENAFTLINALFYKLKAAEKSVRDVGVNKYAEQFASSFDKCYSLISTINDLLHVQPIDLVAVNGTVAQLQNKAETLLNQIDKDYNLAILAENAIVYANVYRGTFTDVQTMLRQDELSFNDGGFEQAYIDAGNILKRYRSN